VPTQVYECPFDGELDYHYKWEDKITETRSCSECGAISRHVIKPPAGVKIVRDWNEKANDYQRDPYTQAKAQLINVYNSARDQGQDVGKPTEEGIQVAAAGIAREKTRSRPDLERQHVAAVQRASRQKLAEQK